MNVRSPILFEGRRAVITTTKKYMTRTQYTKAIERELARLNERIDTKILSGLQYAAESKKHKQLLQQIRSQNSTSIFSRLLLTFH